MPAVLLLALVVRLLYFFQVRGDLFSSNLIIDAKFYDGWARQILSGIGQNRQVFPQDPLYAYFLAGCYWLFGHSFDAIRLIQIGLDVGSIALIFLMGRTAFNEKSGLIAAALGAVYGPMVCFTCLLDKTTLTTFLVALSLASLIYACKRPRPALFLASGISFAMATLTRGNLLIVAACLALWLAVSGGELDWLAKFKRAGAFALGFGAVIALVAIRNYRASGDLVLVTSNAGLNFFIGNNAYTPGNYLEPPFIHGIPEEEYADSKEVAERTLGRPIEKASTVSRFWLLQGLKFVRSSPDRWAALEGRKLYLLLNAFEIPETYSLYYFRDKCWLLWLAPLFLGVLLPLGLLGAGESLAPRLTALHIFLIVYAASVLLFFVTARYRFPIVLPLLIFAGFFLSETVSRWGETPFNSKLAAVTGLLGLAFISNWQPEWMASTVVTPGLSTPHTIAGFLLQSLGRTDASIHELELARDINPSEPTIYAYLADSYTKAGHPEKALPLLVEAVRLKPQFHEALNNLGKIYFDDKNYAMAEKAFQAALSIEPNEPTYRQNYEQVRRLLNRR